MEWVGRRRWRAVACATLIAASVAGTAAGPATAGGGKGHSGEAVVRTHDGFVKGLVFAAHREFAGVPYARPPVGALRWRPPRPAAAWKGVLDATEQPTDCAQLISWDTSTDTFVPEYNEDCLYVNVLTPRQAKPGGKRPVLVWIHGGAFTQGGGRYQDPGHFVAEGDVVVVTINYRVGALGNLAHPSLDGPNGGASEGNYAMMDQQLALRWVKRNISRFGGDPRRITVGGQSSGGGSVCGLMASPASRGLFEQAMLASHWTPRCTFMERSTALERGTRFAANVGCGEAADVAACLRNVPAQQLLEAQAGDLWNPVVGGALLPRQPREAFADGKYMRVPVLIGATHGELLFGRSLSPEDAEAVMRLVLGDEGAEAAMIEYPFEDYADPGDAAYTAIGDPVFSCATRTIAGVLSRRTPTFAYEFDDRNTPVHPLEQPFFGVLPYGAYHGADLKYWLRWLRYDPPFDAAQRALSREMIRYWSRFVTTGDPNARGLPAWPKYREFSDKFMSLRPGGSGVTTDFAREHKCEFWDNAPFPLPTS